MGVLCNVTIVPCFIYIYIGNTLAREYKGQEISDTGPESCLNFSLVCLFFLAFFVEESGSPEDRVRKSCMCRYDDAPSELRTNHPCL